MKIIDTDIRRFKLIEMNDKEYYLVDVDTHKLSWLFPTLTWYLKNKAMRLTRDEYELLKSPKKEISTGKLTLNITAILLGNALYKTISTRWGDNLNNNKISTMTLWLITITIILLVIRAHRSLANYERLEAIFPRNYMDFNNLIYFDKDYKSDFKQKCTKGVVLILLIYGSIIVFSFLAKSVFILTLSFIMPLLLIWTNGALKPESTNIVICKEITEY